MASIDTLNAMIDANIKENGEGAITGNILNNVLKGVASGIGEEVDTRAKVVSDSGINYAEIEGIATNDFYYSMPDSANGNQDDIIATENYLKTINGQSIFGKGNIVIEGGGESYDDTEIKRQLTELSVETMTLQYPELVDVTYLFYRDGLFANNLDTGRFFPNKNISGAGGKYCAVFKTKVGDIFEIVNLKGASSTKAWYKYDAKGRIISNADANVTINETLVMEHDGYIVFNHYGQRAKLGPK
jgi:hypothetical protein